MNAEIVDSGWLKVESQKVLVYGHQGSEGQSLVLAYGHYE